MGILNHPNWAKINTYSAAFVGTIKTNQDAFFAANGKYFQGIALLGPTAKPDGTTDIQVVNASKPYDQNVSWFDFASNVFKNNLKIPIQLKIDVYQAPTGWGWILTAEVWYAGIGPDAYGRNGSHWVYQYNQGPEAMDGIFDEWYIQTDEI